MARLPSSDIAVHEIEITAESAIVECGAVRRGAAAADEGGTRTTAQFGDEVANRRDRWRIQRPDGHPDRVQHANLQLLQRPLAQVLQSGTFHKPCEFLYLGHDCALLVLSCCRVRLLQSPVTGAAPMLPSIPVPGSLSSARVVSC